MSFIRDTKRADEIFRTIRNFGKNIDTLWYDEIDSYNRFIKNYINEPIRISKNGNVQVLIKNCIGILCWSNLRSKNRIPVSIGHDLDFCFLNTKTYYINKGNPINVKKIVTGDISENLSKFMGSLIRYISKHGLKNETIQN